MKSNSSRPVSTLSRNHLAAALRAAMAVTLTSAAACGVEQSTDSDAEEMCDGAPCVPPCSADETDQVCPTYCDELSDLDCCNNTSYYNGEYPPFWCKIENVYDHQENTSYLSCSCNILGPFRPPSLYGT